MVKAETHVEKSLKLIDLALRAKVLGFLEIANAIFAYLIDSPTSGICSHNIYWWTDSLSDMKNYVVIKLDKKTLIMPACLISSVTAVMLLKRLVDQEHVEAGDFQSIQFPALKSKGKMSRKGMWQEIFALVTPEEMRICALKVLTADSQVWLHTNVAKLTHKQAKEKWGGSLPPVLSALKRYGKLYYV